MIKILPEGRHAAALPAGVKAEGRLLHVTLSGRGFRSLEIPTAED